jgi:iron(III) transport system permease protein
MVQVFDTPLIIGLTAGVPVLSTRIYALTSAEGQLPHYGVGAAFGALLLMLAVLLMLGYFRATRVGERFRVIGSRGFRLPRRKLGAWRPLAFVVVFGYLAVMLLPVLILLWASLRPFYDVPSMRSMQQLSLANYASITRLEMVQRAAGNTVILVLAAPTCTMLLACVVSWFAVRRRSFLARLLDVMAFTPMAIPGVVMAMAVLLIYIRTPLYGTIWIIVLAETVVGLAFATRTMNSALLQVHKDLESASAASGATWLTMLRTVLLPLLLPQVLSGWLWCAGYALRDLTVPLLLRAEDNVVVSSALLQLWNQPSLTSASALAMLMILALMVLVVPVQLYAVRKGL